MVGRAATVVRLVRRRSPVGHRPPAWQDCRLACTLDGHRPTCAGRGRSATRGCPGGDVRARRELETSSGMTSEIALRGLHPRAARRRAHLALPDTAGRRGHGPRPHRLQWPGTKVRPDPSPQPRRVLLAIPRSCDTRPWCHAYATLCAFDGASARAYAPASRRAGDDEVRRADGPIRPWRRTPVMRSAGARVVGAARQGNCVEVCLLPSGRVALRDSKDPNGPVLVVSAASFASWIFTLRRDG